MARNKLYYPKSHIIENLYTKGKQWMLEDGTEYIGYYHTYIDNTILTLATYNRVDSKPLIPYVDTAIQSNSFTYNALKAKSNYITPNNVLAIPVLKDYNNGSFSRYFLRRRNYTTYQDIIEINKDQFDSWKKPTGGIDNTLYNAIELNWKLTGPLHDIKAESNIEYGVLDTNKRIISLKDRDFLGLKDFLTDYTELTIYSPIVPKEIKNLFLSKQ